MSEFPLTFPEKMLVVGISHRQASLAIREQFRLSESSAKALIEAILSQGGENALVLSTCNRTEVYATGLTVREVSDLLCRYSGGFLCEFQELGYSLSGKEAVRHFFRVGAGLDSQILGDFQIIGQVKAAFRLSKELGAITGKFEMLINHVIKTSRKVKSSTALSSGTASVSFAAVQYLKEHFPNPTSILLLGLGSIGKATGEHLVKYLGNTSITLMNRSREKADIFAQRHNLRVRPIEELVPAIQEADIVIVATNSPEPIITAAEIPHAGKTLLIDLSLPRNVHPNLKHLPEISVIHTDDLTSVIEDTLSTRQAEIPAAEKIVNSSIKEYLNRFDRWNSPHISALAPVTAI
ncbi:MAG: glutamyl-tRNA reductase [Bacteroidia bacterium]|nr:glutamyl-tRNA reductase [Bacteroidia bacterium]